MATVGVTVGSESQSESVKFANRDENCSVVVEIVVETLKNAGKNV